MKIHKIDFFKNSISQYGVLNSFTEGLQKALKRAELRSETFDLIDSSQGEILAQLAKDQPACTAGFNIVMAKHSFAEPLGIPHLSLIVDCMTYYPEVMQSDTTIACFVEEDSCGFFRLLCKKDAIFLPHAVDAELVSPKNEKILREEKRDLDLVMCGSFIGSEEIMNSWKERLTPKCVDTLVQIAEETIASPHRSHMQAFVEEIERQGHFEKELIKKKVDYFETMNQLEIYIRSVDRIKFLQSIDACDLHIFGAKRYEADWKKVLQGKKRVFFHDAVPHEELVQVFRRARCALNSLPSIKRGLHERLLLALSQGASVLGNENIYITSQFPRSLALLNILPPDYARANDLLHDAFKDEKARLDDVLATHSIIREKHTWDIRAEALLKKLPKFIMDIRQNNIHGVIPFFDKDTHT